MMTSIVDATSADHFFLLLQDQCHASQEQLDDYLLRLSTHLPETQYDALLRKVIETPISPPTLELVLASRECGPVFEKWLRKTFPQDPEKFVDSIHSLLLLRLSTSLPFAYPFERAVALDLGAKRAFVESAPRVLQHLIWYTKQSPRVVSTPDIDPEFEEIAITVQRSQRQRKGGKGFVKTASDSALAKAFAMLGIEYPPADIDGAQEGMFDINDEQLDILELYLSTLQKPSVEEHLRQSHVREEVTEEESTPEVNQEQVAVEVKAAVEVPAAYPMVQPMKAALYFDSAEGFGDWRILISTRADRDLRDARRKDAKFFKIIIKKIKELSKGHFSDDNQKRLNGPNTEIPIFEAKMTRDSRLIYQIDCIPEYDDMFERQIIKIFGVYTHAQINKHLWDSIGQQLFLRKGKEYRQRCIFRSHPKTAGDNVFVPACFPAVEHVSEVDSNLPHLPHENSEEMHTLLVLEKFVPFSQALLNSIIADLDVAHVFNVSPQEREIVEYPYSCYVLGRSGTGKTTTMLFKMLGIERAYTLRKDIMQKPRQIFVTQSRVLAGKVEEYFSKLLDSLATAEKTKEELARLIKHKKQQQDDHEGLIDIDDDQNWRGDLPSRYSQLKDEHFPLFLTFDRLASMLEADMSQHLTTDSLSSGLPHSMRVTPRGLKSTNHITYDRFLEGYWPHLPQNLRKGLDPALVFSELMGVIQGSEEALSQESRFLDKKGYESLSHRAQYAFASRRDTIYAIFLSYLKQKRTSEEYDAADRTHRILNVFQTTGVPGQKIDYLYVDEAQDNLLIDALLLRSLVRNPDGLFWAGDTAQTISVGSSFRFNDLKAFLFRLEKRREQIVLENDNDSVFKQEAPRTFQLAVNYRSHGGIVQCAHSVIELITEFWPYAIDVLARERGVVDGSKPVFFSGWDSETVRYEQFLFGESESPIEFGAQQCILVRDEKARDDLRKQVGDIGLIMTLYESKGLEFDDVLLYKFFEDSTVELSQWRVVLNLLKGIHDKQDTPAPLFDQIRHAGVCSELKFLYVAITRARKNLWLVDCSEKGEPMRVLWTEKNEIQNCTPGTDVPRLAVSSSSDEWEKSGRTLFSNKRYLQAMHCFERAGLGREVAVSHTYYLREQARLTPTSTSKQAMSTRQTAFAVAAEAFLECSESSRNAKERKAYLRSAGDCFEHAREEYKAAEAYSKAEEYNIAVKLYRKCARFDEAVNIVKANPHHVDVDVAENIIDIAKLFYFRGGELEKANQLFDSIEDALEYLEDFDLDVSRASLLENLGKFGDAADIHLAEGRTLDAIRLLLMDKDNEHSIRRGYHCILQGLWEKVSYGVKGLDRIEQVVRLLKLASSLKFSDVESLDIDELSMFEAIRSNNQKDLRDLGRKFSLKSLPNPAILCFDHYFTDIPVMYTLSPSDISDVLQDFLAYCNLLQHLIHTANPCRSPQICKLFSILPLQEGTFLLPTATYLNNRILEVRTPLLGTNDQGIIISEWELSRRLKDFIADWLREQIYKQNKECQRAQAFNTCTLSIVGYCARRECPDRHIPTVVLTSNWFNLQVKIHLQQLLIVQIWCNLMRNPGERMKQIRDWIGRISNIFYPVLDRLGGVHSLDTASIPEASNAFALLRGWCLELLYGRHRHDEPRLLTTAYQVVKLCFYLDKQNTLELIKRSPLLGIFRGLSLFQRPNGENSVCFVDELFYSVSTVNITAVARGVLSVKHVLDARILIDANALFRIIEFLCGSIILIRKRFNLHNVTLPHSWLDNILRVLDISDLRLDLPQPAHLWLQTFVDCMQGLLDSLFAEKHHIVHILADQANLLVLHSTRNVFIARLCRIICLLGYNVLDESLRTNILKIMQSLNSRPDRPPHGLYKDYASAKHWRDIAKLIQKSMSNYPLDGLIHLIYESYKQPASNSFRMRRIVYKSIVDIPSLLNGSGTKPSTVLSTLRPQAPVFVPKPLVNESPMAALIEPEQNINETEADDAEINNATTVADIITVEGLQDTTAPLSEALNEAALRCQSLYRKKVRCKQKGSELDSLKSIQRTNCFEACLLVSTKIDWAARSHYQRVFLGPLPHILVCLKSAHTWASEMKTRNKKRLTSGTHQELEDIMKRLTDQKKIIKRIQGLQKILDPSSELHRGRDIEQLKKHVSDVEALITEIGSSLAHEVASDLAIGLKGIVAIPKPPKRKPKPTLVDDENYAYMDEESVDEELDEGPIQSEDDHSVQDIVEEPVVVMTGGYSPKQERVREESADTVIQSLPWVPVPAESQNPSSDASSESQSDHDDLLMQSLAWVSI
ncbi:hypothetical protein HYPSUDRAFT_32443 [Hypholoma sublateritium FD-334 SS-4]|uniref:UvrD-like helicase ATP-binding domain-containing protein n=1 Tax=Hypholoma sublateritium (strain FD-334 SS-4) TaxID=945553 RepID=A0A0D2LM88_HYPSF|nr:hypothetical protein HYPSUDRAFT_32443 [Hypholoma sublateritium FD-334 SS-4]